MKEWVAVVDMDEYMYVQSDGTLTEYFETDGPR